MIKVIVTVIEGETDVAVNVRKEKTEVTTESEEYLAKVAETGAMTALQIQAEQTAKAGGKVDMISVKKGSDTAKALRKHYGI